MEQKVKFQVLWAGKSKVVSDRCGFAVVSRAVVWRKHRKWTNSPAETMLDTFGGIFSERNRRPPEKHSLERSQTYLWWKVMVMNRIVYPLIWKCAIEKKDELSVTESGFRGASTKIISQSHAAKKKKVFSLPFSACILAMFGRFVSNSMLYCYYRWWIILFIWLDYTALLGGVYCYCWWILLLCVGEF